MPRKIMSRGVGESKVNRDPSAPSIVAALSGLHVGGVAIEDLPEERIAQLAYGHTDEGIEERNRGKVESAARVTSTHEGRQSTATSFDRFLEERRDFRTNASAADFQFSPDFVKEKAERFCRPGMRAALLSPMKIEREGLRGNEIVRDEKGDPVKVGRMVLAEQPEAVAKARKEFYRRKGAERLGEIETQHAERQRELDSDD